MRNDPQPRRRCFPILEPATARCVCLRKNSSSGEGRMLAKLKKVVAGAALFFVAGTAHAQSGAPPETKNAALRYWLAFADLQDPPTDKATAELLEKTAAGETAWGQTKDGPVLEQNEPAHLRVRAPPQILEGHWGVGYDLGPAASSAYVPQGA